MSDEVMIPLEERMRRVREVLDVLKHVHVPYMPISWFYSHAMRMQLVELFIDAYDGKPHEIHTNSTFFRALQESLKAVELIGPLLKLTAEQRWRLLPSRRFNDSANG